MNNSERSVIDYLIALPQYFVPGHLVSRLIYLLTRTTYPKLRIPLIRWFIKHFSVDMGEALVESPEAYISFNDFFTRPLRPNIRPLAEGEGVVTSPVDGRISQFGAIDGDQIFQAKGHHYTLQDLVGGFTDLAEPFHNGHFATIYLSPSDYHRIHMPLDGKLQGMVHVPGRLFSVNPATTRTIPRLFARNERVVTLFDTPSGPMGLVMVGAINVGSIETVWANQVTPPAGRVVRRWRYSGEQQTQLAKGREMGRFNMGSTVILLLPNRPLAWRERCAANLKVKMGEALAELTP